MSLKRKAGDLPSSSDPKKPKGNASITSFFQAPKSTALKKGSSAATTAAGSSTKSASPTDDAAITDRSALPVTFDREKWASTLTDEQKELLGLEIKTLDATWFKELKEEMLSKEFLDLKRFLKKEHDSGKKIFPPAEDVYSWSRHCPLNKVKAVILGQDPYHNVNQAHGLSFSVRHPTPAPPSLKNIYKALQIDYPTFRPPPDKGGLLTPWADRGVLLLNTCLTVRAHEANSHSNRGWEKFTQKVIDTVAKKRNRGVVFLAWGSPAAKRVVKIDKEKHLVLLSVHPSPMSASRGWFECGHFRKTNEWLANRYGEDEVIDWSLDVPEVKKKQT